MDPRDVLLREAEQIMLRAIAFEATSPTSMRDMGRWMDDLHSELGSFGDCDVEGEKGWVRNVDTGHGPASVCVDHREGRAA